MAKFHVLCILVISSAILSAMTIAPLASAQECYEIHPEILCENGNTDSCLAFCTQKFGPNTTVQCMENSGFVGPFCVCNDCPPSPPPP